MQFMQMNPEKMWFLTEKAAAHICLIVEIMLISAFGFIIVFLKIISNIQASSERI